MRRRSIPHGLARVHRAQGPDVSGRQEYILKAKWWEMRCPAAKTIMINYENFLSDEVSALYRHHHGFYPFLGGVLCGEQIFSFKGRAI